MKGAMSWLLALGLLAGLQAGDQFSWPQWRGPDRTDVSLESGLLKYWPSGGPKRIWLFKEAGPGYAGFAIVNGKLFTMGSQEDKEYLLVLDADKGEELWRVEIGPMYHNNYGDGPRGTPTVDGDHVYALGGQGTLLCVRISDHQKVWQKRMQDLGGSIPNWGYTESVLIDGDKVICTPGGSRGTLAALNNNTGDLIWQSKDFTVPAHYSSAIVAVVHGVREYIQLTEKVLAGIDAASGKLMWKVEWPGRTAVIPTPIFHDNHVFVTSGYGAGCKLINLTAPDKAEEVYANKNMVNHHGGVILYDDHLYGFSDGKGWVCQDFKTGEIVWSERSKLGKGCMTCVNGMLYCLDERSGNVVLIEASTKGWREHGRFKLEPQTKNRKERGGIWTHPVVVNGKLYLRDQEIIGCYDVKAELRP
jgi:outer membrane protein assembly factor BamB